MSRAIMISHFPLINLAEDTAFCRHNWRNGSPPSKGPFQRTHHKPLEMGYDNRNLGAPENRAVQALSFLHMNKIHLSLSGHAHRAAVYRTEAYKADDDPSSSFYSTLGNQSDEGLEGLTLELSTHSYAIVCGSSGPYGKQNIYGEFEGLGIEKPQGMTVNVGTGELQVIRASGHKKPRIAVVAEYMHIHGVPLIQGGIICKPEGTHCRAEFYPMRNYFAYFGRNFIEKMTLCAVNFKNSDNPIQYTVEFYNPSQQTKEDFKIVLLSPFACTSIQGKVKEILNDCKFFIRLDFADNRGLGAHYELTGYNFPVSIKIDHSGDFIIYRGWNALYLEIKGERGDTLPDFSEYKNLDEYKDIDK
jgi:hypothetical protein